MKAVDLGLVPHAEAEVLQAALVAEMLQGRGEPTLFVCQHPAVITLGRRGGREALLCGDDALRARGIDLRRCARGGEATAHFPGQLVAYPVMPLERRPGGLKAWVADLEAAVMATAAVFGVHCRRRKGFPGVWTERGKLASVGVAVKRWVGYHGVAMNVEEAATRDGPFACIKPCNLDVAPVSLEAEAGRVLKVDDVKHVLIQECQARLAHPSLA